MSKGRKGESPLRFDTSLPNINCFIRGKSRPNHEPSRSKPHLKRLAKPPEFHDRAFLESVVSKILNEGDCEGITELIDNMVFPSTGSHDSNNDPSKDSIEQERIQRIFSDPHRASQRPVNGNWPASYGQFYAVTGFHGDVGSAKRQCTTMVHSGSNSLLGASREEFNPEVMLNMYSYYELYPRMGSPQYRKRRAPGQQNPSFAISLDRIEADGRTTLMIRHIPNKYSQQMLYQEISRNNKHRINFLYLPIDHTNTCNVGYAFVNFIHSKFILDFYHEFNGRKWDRFNSEKICQLAYARIQGTANLIDHYHSPGVRLIKKEERKGVGELDEEAMKGIDKMLSHQRVEDC